MDVSSRPCQFLPSTQETNVRDPGPNPAQPTVLSLAAWMAASLALVVSVGTASAQSAGGAGKPDAAPKAAAKPAAPKPSGAAASGLGGGQLKPGEKLMTRDELRVCLQRQDKLVAQLGEHDRQRLVLDEERKGLEAEGEALRAERAAVDARGGEVKAFQEKARVLAARVTAFNARQNELNEKRAASASDIKALDEERKALMAESEALESERKTLISSIDDAAKAYNAKATARDAKVGDWNNRNAALVAEVKDAESARESWRNECGNRPYREDDEKAIRAGK